MEYSNDLGEMYVDLRPHTSGTTFSPTTWPPLPGSLFKTLWGYDGSATMSPQTWEGIQSIALSQDTHQLAIKLSENVVKEIQRIREKFGLGAIQQGQVVKTGIPADA